MRQLIIQECGMEQVEQFSAQLLQHSGFLRAWLNDLWTMINERNPAARRLMRNHATMSLFLGYLAGHGYGVWPIELESRDLVYQWDGTIAGLNKALNAAEVFMAQLEADPGKENRFVRAQEGYLTEGERELATKTAVIECFLQQWNVLEIDEDFPPDLIDKLAQPVTEEDVIELLDREPEDMFERIRGLWEVLESPKL